MTNIERLKVRLPEATEAELEDVLESAKDVILSRCFVSVSRTSEEDKATALTVHNEKVLDVAVVITFCQLVAQAEQFAVQPEPLLHFFFCRW